MRTAGVGRLKISKHPTGNRTRDLPSVHRIKHRTNGYEMLMSQDEQTERNFGDGLWVKSKTWGAVVPSGCVVRYVWCVVRCFSCCEIRLVCREICLVCCEICLVCYKIHLVCCEICLVCCEIRLVCREICFVCYDMLGVP
jgi:hypothetical protein